MKYYIAIDGGGTKVRALLFNEHYRLCAVSSAGGINHNTLSRLKTEKNLRACITGLFRSFERVRVESVIGTLVAADEESVCFLQSLLGSHCSFFDISEGRMGALINGIYPDALVVLCGTGSNVFYVKNGDIIGTIGGFGALIGDDGSGFWMGRAAFRSALADFEGRGPQTMLTEEIVRQVGEPLWDAAFSVYKRPEPVSFIASLTRSVETAANRQDPEALRILREAGESLAQQALAAFRKFQIPYDIPVGLMGGAFQTHPLIAKTMIACLTEHYPGLRFHTPMFEPVVGGVLYKIFSDTGAMTEDRLSFMKTEYKQLLATPLF